MIQLVDKAYGFLFRKLMRGMASDEKLSVARLAAECGVSRTPMAEAIHRLIDEGVLMQKSRSGTYPAAFSRFDLEEAYDLREALELHALAKIASAMPERTLRRLESCCLAFRKALEILRDGKSSAHRVAVAESRILESDLAYHIAILDAAGNARASAIVRSAFQRNRFFDLPDAGRPRSFQTLSQAWGYHVRILKAVKAGDAARAVDLLRRHIRRSCRDACTRLAARARS